MGGFLEIVCLTFFSLTFGMREIFNHIVFKLLNSLCLATIYYGKQMEKEQFLLVSSAAQLPFSSWAPTLEIKIASMHLLSHTKDSVSIGPAASELGFVRGSGANDLFSFI